MSTLDSVIRRAYWMKGIVLILIFLCLTFHVYPVHAANTDYEPVEKGLIEKQENAEREEREKQEEIVRKERAEQEALARKKRMEDKLRTEKFHVNISYAMFTPLNKAFSEMAGTATGFSIGTDMYKYYWIGVDAWSSSSSKLSTVQSLKAQAVSIGGKYPNQINEYLMVYVAGGVRLESLSINDGDATYGNNALVVSLGGKLRMTESIGIDANIGQTFGAKHTDYTIMKAGVFYAF